MAIVYSESTLCRDAGVEEDAPASAPTPTPVVDEVEGDPFCCFYTEGDACNCASVAEEGEVGVYRGRAGRAYS